MNISAIALGGLEQAQADLLRASQHAVNPAEPVDVVSLSSEAVAVIAAKNQFEAGISVLQTADQMEQSALALITSENLSTEKPSS